MENIQTQGALDFSAPFLFVPPPGQKLLPQHATVQPKQPRKPKPEPQQEAKKEEQPAGHPLPPEILEKDFSTGEWILWDTIEHRELFRGTRDEALKFGY